MTPPVTVEQELLPCPFCGHDGELFDDRDGVTVLCTNAACGEVRPKPFPTDEAALAAWNTRIASQSEGWRDDVETLLRTVFAAGEAEDEHYEILSRWRDARAEKAMSAWSWWWKLPEDESYQTDEPSREDVLATGRREEPDAAAIEIIEARLWADDIEGEEESRFADSRNNEIVQTPPASEADDGE
jgi:hypothetical protein